MCIYSIYNTVLLCIYDMQLEGLTCSSVFKWLLGNYCGYYNILSLGNEEQMEIFYHFMCIDICTSTQCMNINLDLLNTYYA